MLPDEQYPDPSLQQQQKQQRYLKTTISGKTITKAAARTTTISGKTTIT
jgi:hypothetical protein